MDYPKEILVKDYFEVHKYYSDIYGKDRTIVLMQVGSFHEAYCTDEDGLNLVDLSQSLDICCTRKNSNIPLSKTNPRMMGFPIHVTNNFIDKLIDMFYTIVLIDQVTEPPNPKRKVTGVYSPATHIEKKTNKTNYLVSIVLDKIKDMKTNSYQLCIGLASYDLATGDGAVYETYSTQSDILLGLDNAVRFMENYPPREIVLETIITDELSMSVGDILAYLNIEPGKAYVISKPIHRKIAYQKNILESIYKIETNIDIIEYIGLQYLNWARLSLVILLDYVQSHQPMLLNQIRVPRIFSSNKYLYLGNRALEQLDITPGKSESLFNIINFTKTSIGKRYLLSQLTMPLIDMNELNKRYNTISKIITTDSMNKIIDCIEDIYDLDKLIRKLEINNICPMELYQLYISIYNIIKLCNCLKENKLYDNFDINSDTVKTTKKLIDWIETKFILDKMNGLNFVHFNETDQTFYNININKSIDTIQESINTSQNFMDYLIKALEHHIDDKVYFKKAKGGDSTPSLISLKFNDRDGHYLLITNRRCEILKKNLAKITKLKVGTIELNIDDLEFSELPKSSNTKINCKKIKEISLNLVNYKIEMAKKLKEVFKQDMKVFYDTYKDTLYNWSKKIAMIDFINSGAICASTYHYCKPTINIMENSYFKGTELRHPIIERISTSTTYIPHDIMLGTTTPQDGILLYGINSSGKSTLMKSIGLNIVLAQIGYYVAATTFEYSPYTSLFTRICGNDNMFKGLSSFMVEMMELIAILKRNTKNTLILGDELAKGTEFRSGIVIVSYMLETLIKSGASFITATHLHDINKLESIKQLERLKTKHLKITYDMVKDMLIYDRSLLDGQGETFYGLMVAKYMMKDKTFNERTTEILKEYDNIGEKTSKYNTNVIIKCCEICKSKEHLETHHIVWQKDFKASTSAFYLQKNNESNLVILCDKCHDMVDRNEIIINGWKNTSNGRLFDYTMNTKKEKVSKYSIDMIDYIAGLKGTDANMIRIKVKEKFNKRISVKSIEKLVK